MKTRAKFGWALAAMILPIQVFAVDVKQPSAQSPQNFELTAKTKFSDLQKIPDSQMIKTKSGRMVRAGNLKALANMIKSAKSGGTPAPSMKMPPPTGAPQLQIPQGFNFHNLSKRPPSDILELPSGRKLTVAQFKKVDAFAKATTGKSILERQAPPPNTSGAAIKIKSSADLKALESKPDSTILEGPLGKRITLGELRAYAKKHNKPVGVK